VGPVFPVNPVLPVGPVGPRVGMVVFKYDKDAPLNRIVNGLSSWVVTYNLRVKLVEYVRAGINTVEVVRPDKVRVEVVPIPTEVVPSNASK
jgi:hypothetical protein